MCNMEDSRLLTQHTTAANRILTETDKTNRAIRFIRSYSYHTCTRLSTSMDTAHYRPTNSTSFLQLRCRGLLNQPSFRCRPPPCRLGIPKRVSAGKEPLLQGHSSESHIERGGPTLLHGNSPCMPPPSLPCTTAPAAPLEPPCTTRRAATLLMAASALLLAPLLSSQRAQAASDGAPAASALLGPLLSNQKALAADVAATAAAAAPTEASLEEPDMTITHKVWMHASEGCCVFAIINSSNGVSAGWCGVSLQHPTLIHVPRSLCTPARPHVAGLQHHSPFPAFAAGIP